MRVLINVALLMMCTSASKLVGVLAESETCCNESDGVLLNMSHRKNDFVLSIILPELHFLSAFSFKVVSNGCKWIQLWIQFNRLVSYTGST